MGNCMETFGVKQEINLLNRVREKIQEGVREDGEIGVKKGQGEGGLKVKVLLTKGELEWLMVKLKEKGGERGIEDLLIEMERERSREEEERGVVRWRPSLESIMEVPEVQTFNDEEDRL